MEAILLKEWVQAARLGVMAKTEACPSLWFVCPGSNAVDGDLAGCSIETLSYHPIAAVVIAAAC